MASTRRTFCAGVATAPLAAQAKPVRTESGYTQDWFQDSFLNLREDAHEAAQAGQSLAVVFEQRGCPYCLEMHTDHLAQAEIEGFIRPRFRLIQLDLQGARPVTDFDNEVLEERQLARRWRVTVTPTIVFLPLAVPASARPGREIEVARMAGLLRKPQFLGMFIYVAERGYSDGISYPVWWTRRQAG